MPESETLAALLARVMQLARDYYVATGRPLGVTGEIAEYEACRLLGLQLADVRTAGYDAIERENGREKRVQIKGRRQRSGGAWGRVGAIDLAHDFDTVMLVLLDENYETVEILEADAQAVRARLAAPGSRARNERGQMDTAQFRSIAVVRWPAPTL